MHARALVYTDLTPVFTSCSNSKVLLFAKLLGLCSQHASGCGVVTAVKIERCAIHMPPSWASCLDEWDGNTRIEPRLNAPDAEPTTYYYSFTVK